MEANKTHQSHSHTHTKPPISQKTTTKKQITHIKHLQMHVCFIVVPVLLGNVMYRS